VVKTSSTSFIPENYSTDVPEGKIVLLQGGKPFVTNAAKTEPPSQLVQASWTSDGQHHWFRANVLGTDENLVLIGNPIYVN